MHNHPPSKDLSGHPSHRRFTKEEFVRIQEMTISGITPKQILSSLRQGNGNLKSISRSEYNARAKFRKESLQGRTVLEALFEELGEADFIFDVQHDHDGHLTHLFIAHPASIALTKNYSSFFLMDCTYKTNKYGMPLLNIGGVTSFNSTFFSAFVFLRKEETSDYIWALKRFVKVLGMQRHPAAIVTDRELALMNALKIIFPDTPHLLCEIKTQLSHEKIRIPHKFHIPLLCHINGRVSLYALKELFKQYELAVSDVSSICKGNFTNSMDLPRAHKIKTTNFQPLQLIDIHPH
ncbi:MULE domain-containing protein [Heracleum sosnowskyi]|uniref:MULE domain-containing protein n=1 Tax=Heracleum sosnowskyi TaxID=360622 RepID=A0AAD8I6K7_9APIA|nr:MULE domain-containing protein [Heracleum sosnowskyi]